MKEYFNRLPKHIKIIACIVAAIILVTVLLLATVKLRVIGSWRSETYFDSTSDSSKYIIHTFNADGTFVRMVYYDDGDTSREKGFWEVKGFMINWGYKESNYYLQYKFNPITGTYETATGLTFEKIGF